MMKSQTQTPPDWFDEALSLKATGYSCRAIREHFFTEKGLDVSHTVIWHWVTAAGRRDMRRRQSDAHRAYIKAYQSKYRERKAKAEKGKK